jgi:hypothetical protein
MRTVPQSPRQAVCNNQFPSLSFLAVLNHVDGVLDLLIYVDVDGFQDPTLMACELDELLSNPTAHFRIVHVHSILGMGREGDGEALISIFTVCREDFLGPMPACLEEGPHFLGAARTGGPGELHLTFPPAANTAALRNSTVPKPT